MKYAVAIVALMLVYTAMAQDAPRSGLPCCPGTETVVPLAGNPDPSQPRRVLRVAADPNNLPFSNDRLEGFENRIAEVVARELNADLVYEWRAQRRGFFRLTLKEGDVDLVLGAPVGSDRALVTEPYYTSTYCFVSREDRHLDISSFDDPRLREFKVGVQVVGDDGFNPPAAHVLADKGIVDNVIGFSVYGNYAEPNPPARIVDAVVKGEVDVAIVWGPLAGYFAQQEPVPIALTPVEQPQDSPFPFIYSIGMGVKKQNLALREELNLILQRHRAEIEKILASYGVPLAPPRAQHAALEED